MPAKPETKPKDAASPPAIWATDRTHIRVRVPEGERRRAGRKFTDVPVVFAKADLTDDEARAIRDDLILGVEEVDAPAKSSAD